jgi:hypothetical protein
MPATYVKGQALFIYLSAGETLGNLRWSRLLGRVR